MHTLNLIFEYWWLALWIGASIIAYVVGGWRLATTVATAGIAHLAFREGGKRADESRRARDRETEKRLESGYDKIAQRGIDRDGVSKRLRDGKL
jgi:hypothetical protein